ncbi:thyrotropin-releasing hormone receptor-like [Gigantopelta aegis]|uniref:thyrotropin-releasing hormone receptor-like n=1 Tax=Gigantopelta aegis TaxID=1735272 RepID=UPI001B887F84|nr:thyrotropin-releasing hormone receptor-like [Gigantopelta aegis]
MASMFNDYTTIEDENATHMSPNTSFMEEYTSYTTTESTYVLKKEDFLEYQISLKIKLYSLPVILLIGVPGNVISFAVLVFSNLRRSTTSLYLAVISVLDTIVLATGVFWYLSSEMPHLRVINDVSCRLVNVVFYVSIHYNVLLVVAVTVERFIVVVFPLKAQLWISMRRTVVVIVCCGVFSFGLNLCHVFIRTVRISRATGKPYCGSTGGQTTIFFLYRIYPWIDSIMYCILPMTSLFVLNMVMLRHMKKVIRSRQSMQCLHAKENQSSQSSQRQMTTMLLLVSFSFLILTGPIGTFLVVRRNAWTPKMPKEKAIMDLLSSVINNMAYTNHAINFVFYCFSGQRFRNELRRMCTRLVAKSRKPNLQRDITVISK